MVAVYPGGTNTFVPSHEDSNRLTIDFSRNPSRFPLNRYITLVPVKRVRGYYLNMTVEERMRILGTDLAHYNWADGQDAPTGIEGMEEFEFIEFLCRRYAYAAQLGDIAVDNASWSIVSQHADIKAQQAMTGRTVRALAVIALSTNYPTGHTATTTVAGGGTWDAATTANLYIKKSIDYAVKQILQATGSVVKSEELNLVFNPNLASEMAESQEVADHVKGSPYALAYIRGDLEGKGGNDVNRRFGLPEVYSGVNLVIEDTVKVTSKKAATRASAFALGDATPFIAARPGGLVGAYGGPSFSTGTLFVYEKDDLAVETKRDDDNRRTTVRVVDHIAPALTAGISGFAFTGAT